VEHEIVFVNDSSEIPESITKSSTSNAVSIEAGTRFYSDQTISFITIHDGKKPENYGNAATELYGATTDLKDLSPNPSDIRKRLDIETMANRFGDAFMFAAAGKTYTVYDRKEGELGFATITVNDSVSDYDYSIKPDSVDLPMYHLIQHTLIDVKS
jgi:hypothetical protein